MSLFKFPTQASSPDAWRAFLASTSMDTPELLAYVYQLYERERVLSVRYHQILLALAHLADGYTTATPAAQANTLTQCVDCGQSVVVDGAEYGRLLPCGHVMHSFCMATYCDTGNEVTAPGCRRCGVRFTPSAGTPESQIEVAKVLTAVRIMSGTPLEQLRQEYQDNGVVESTELDKLLLNNAAEQAVKDAATVIISEHKQFLRRLATAVAEKLIPTVQEPRPFPAVPTPTAATADATAADSTKKSAGYKTAEPAAKKPYVAAMPPNLEPDVLPPPGAVVPKGTRYQERAIMFTSFSSKCKLCKRPQEANRTIIASGDQGFACCICVFNKTSAELYQEVFGSPSVESMLS
jgi:hypothetical protein